MRGLTQRDNFDAAEQPDARAGRYLGMRFDWLGRIKASKATPSARTDAVDLGACHHQRATYYMLSSGPLAGYWVRDTPTVHPA